MYSIKLFHLYVCKRFLLWLNEIAWSNKRLLQSNLKTKSVDKASQPQGTCQHCEISCQFELANSNISDNKRWGVEELDTLVFKDILSTGIGTPVTT